MITAYCQTWFSLLFSVVSKLTDLPY